MQIVKQELKQKIGFLKNIFSKCEKEKETFAEQFTTAEKVFNKIFSETQLELLFKKRKALGDQMILQKLLL